MPNREKNPAWVKRGEELKRQMLRLGLKPRDVAAMTGKKPDTVRKVMRGEIAFDATVWMLLDEKLFRRNGLEVREPAPDWEVDERTIPMDAALDLAADPKVSEQVAKVAREVGCDVREAQRFVWRLRLRERGQVKTRRRED